MMWVWNKTSYGSKDSERLDFEMGGFWNDVWFVGSDVGVTLLIDIQVLHKSLFQKILKSKLFSNKVLQVYRGMGEWMSTLWSLCICFVLVFFFFPTLTAVFTYVYVLLSHTRLSVLNNDERSTNTTTIRGQVDGSLMVVDEYGDELRHTASTTHATEIAHELFRSTSDTKDATV